MSVDRHFVRYFEFAPGERVTVKVEEQGDRVFAKLWGAESLPAEKRSSKEIAFVMPESEMVDLEVGTATTAELDKLLQGGKQIVVEIRGDSGAVHRHNIDAEATPGQWNYSLIPRSSIRHMAASAPSWFVCTNKPPCPRKSGRLGPANTICPVCGKGMIVRV